MEIIYTLTPIALMLFCLFYVLINRNKELLDNKIKLGYICYDCKRPTTNEDYIEYVSNRIEPFKEELKICKKCNRDIKISQLSGKKYIKYISKFKKLIFDTERYKRLIIITFTIYFTILAVYFILLFSLDKKVLPLFYTYNIILTIYWLIITYKFNSSIKKPSN